MKAHLVLAGWYRPGTGFSRVLQSLLPSLVRQHRITWLGIGYQGPPQTLGPDVELLPTNLRGGAICGAYWLRQNWSQIAPDAVLVLNDLWYLAHHARELAAIKGQTPLLGYLPLDGRLQRSEWVRGLAGFDRLCTYTEVAARDLTAALAAEQLDIAVGVAGHGVDHQRFVPLLDPTRDELLAERMRRAQALFGLDAPAPVILNASRPDPRKGLELSVRAFALAWRRRPDLRLCLHQAIGHEGIGAELRALAESLGVAGQVLYWPPRSGPLSDEELNQLYNACALGLNTALGEGFGLVSFEQAACAVPQLLPDHAALAELWADAALRIPVHPCRFEYSPLQMAAIDVEAAAASMVDVLDDPAAYAERALACRQHTLAAQFDWRKVAQDLMRFLQLRHD